MKSINIDLVKKYINGEDLGEVSIDELENDPAFMLSVINASKDKKMYNFCSDEVKLNYDFVKELIMLNKNDYEFIDTVAQYYFDNSKEDKNVLELSILMRQLLPMCDTVAYSIFSETQFSADQVDFHLQFHDQSEDVKAALGEGFCYYFEKYDSEIILDFYAKKMVDTIIEDYEINFKKRIYSKSLSKEDREKFNVAQYIIDTISMYDNSLGIYLSTHIYVVEYLKQEIKSILENWDKGFKFDREERCLNVFDMVYEYIAYEETKIDWELDARLFLYKAAKELNIQELIKKIDKELTENMERVLEIGYTPNEIKEREQADIEYLNYDIKNNLPMYAIYNNVKKIVANQMYEACPSNLFDIVNMKSTNLENKKNKSKCKIIEINNK